MALAAKGIGDPGDLDLTVIAGLLGVGRDPFEAGDVHAAGAQVLSARWAAANEGRAIGWEDVTR